MKKEFDLKAFKEQPVAYIVEALGFNNPEDAIKYIFTLALDDINWIKNIKTPVSDEFDSKADAMVNSLLVDKLEIEDTDDETHLIRQSDFPGTCYDIAIDPEKYWILEDLVTKTGAKAKFAANMFVQLMTFNDPVKGRSLLYFG